MNNVIVAGAVRTAIGTLGGSISKLSAVDLGAQVMTAAIERAGIDPSVIDEVIMGQVIQAGAGPNPARQALLAAGLPKHLPAYTVNKVCASGMKAVSLAHSSIASGEQRIVLAGGMESMSGAPYVLHKAREGYRLGHGRLEDTVLTDALEDPILRRHMGTTAETLAAEHAVSREDQDRFALQSQQRAWAAIDAGRFDAEIVPVAVPQRRGDPVMFSHDEHPRRDASLEALARLNPAFVENGTVTAGNASGINDGAAAMILADADEAQRLGIQPLARIVATASTALEPERMGLGPVSATRCVLDKAGLSLSEIDAIELNEAFASQALAVIGELGLDEQIVNVHGGAIALGHPVGATGARIIVTLLHVLADRSGRYGLATLCVGGGQGMAVIVERVG